MSESSPFQSSLIDEIRASGGTYRLDNGKVIILPETFGFCSGVRGAVAKLEKTLEKFSGRNIWLLGAMIHNPAVNTWFTVRGVRMIDFQTLDTVFTSAAPDDVFVIPAFGLPVDMDSRLRSFVSGNGVIVDATCPFVRRVWECAEKAGRRGDAVILHGKHAHQETNGIWSRAVQYGKTCVLIPSPENARDFARSPESLPDDYVYNGALLKNVPWTLVNQTTMLEEETKEVANILAKAPWHDNTLEFAGTLCTATKERQKAAAALCNAECDLILVLGGIDSSNTAQLFRLAVKNTALDKCFFVRSAEDLTGDTICHFNPDTGIWSKTDKNILDRAGRIGILTGASCPDSELEKLVRALQ